MVLTSTSPAGEVKILDVVVQRNAENLYRFDVTLQHEDSGWEHYADAWEILSPDGRVIKQRVLFHPHVEEQPFTRSLDGVELSDGWDHVLIRAHDKVHGYAAQTFRVNLVHPSNLGKGNQSD